MSAEHSSKTGTPTTVRATFHVDHHTIPGVSVSDFDGHDREAVRKFVDRAAMHIHLGGRVTLEPL